LKKDEKLKENKISLWKLAVIIYIDKNGERGFCEREKCSCPILRKKTLKVVNELENKISSSGTL